MRERLSIRVRHALAPARFPERRDVELAFRVSEAAEGLVFFDHFWIDSTSLWAAGAQLDTGGLEGGIAAIGQRQLLRALAAELKDPRAVVDEWTRRHAGCPDALSVLSLDTATGMVGRAALGAASCEGPARLDPGGIQWLTVGSDPLPRGEPVPVEGLQNLVDRRAGPSSWVLAALHYKGATRKANSTTLVVRNDRASVPDALAAIRTHLDRHAVADEDAAALELALDELLTNQINYGFRDGLAHEILVEVGVDGNRLSVEIRDDGIPFDPLSVSRPDLEAGLDERQLGGLGMHFVRTLVDDVSYRRRSGWNVVALGKRLAPPEEQSS